MADRPTETRPMREMLASIDRDMAAMPLPVRKEERSPDEQQRIADLTGDVLRKAVEDAIAAIMGSLEKAEDKLAAQRKQAEKEVADLRAWVDNFARQNTELVERCIAIEQSVTDTVRHIIQIGQKPLNDGNSRGETSET